MVSLVPMPLPHSDRGSKRYFSPLAATFEAQAGRLSHTYDIAYRHTYDLAILFLSLDIRIPFVPCLDY